LVSEEQKRPTWGWVIQRGREGDRLKSHGTKQTRDRRGDLSIALDRAKVEGKGPYLKDQYGRSDLPLGENEKERKTKGSLMSIEAGMKVKRNQSQVEKIQNWENNRRQNTDFE